MRAASIRTWLVIGGLCVVAAVSGLSYGRPGFLRPGTEQWIRVWNADFGGPAGSGVAPGQWRYQTGAGRFGNGEVQTMTSSPGNVHLDGRGDLDITALRRAGEWTSGRIQSRADFSPPPGGELRVTASLRQPGPADGVGYWPAFWLLGLGSWPAHGEIDILEDVNALSLHSGALHCGNLTQLNRDGTLGPCHEHAGRSSGMLLCPGCQRGFHRYSVIIDRRDPADQRIQWYLDGRQFFAVTERQVGARPWAEAVDHGFSIILDLAIGGSFPDARCGCASPTGQTTSGGTLQVRSVAVYRR
jgi:beta-glucanase (GH16 family)